MLEKMFHLQRLFNNSIGHKVNFDNKEETVKWIERWCCYMHQEIAEFLDWFPYKHWSKRSGNKELSPEELWSKKHLKEAKLELVDTFCFFISACEEIDMDAEELFKLYKEKMDTNYKRQEGGDY